MRVEASFSQSDWEVIIICIILVTCLIWLIKEIYYNLKDKE